MIIRHRGREDSFYNGVSASPSPITCLYLRVVKLDITREPDTT